MDEIYEYNKARWTALAEADALFTRPKFDLNAESAKELVNSDGRFGDLEEKKVLCLAGGGGQQSAAFALLGADVTVFDISEEQIERDRKVAKHYGFQVETFQGDMRDLSALKQDFFDVVFHPYSINFVTNASLVFEQVANVLKDGGIYQVQFANPFAIGIKQEDWNGEGYILKKAYRKDAVISYADQDWVYDKDENKSIQPPKEYSHLLGDFVNGLIKKGFIIRNILDNENMCPDENAEPKSWDHFVAYAPPWLSILSVYKPNLKF